jgi:hypothetical protein
VKTALAAKDDFKPVKLQRPGPDHRVQSLPRRDNSRQCLSGFEATITSRRRGNHKGIAGKSEKNSGMRFSFAIVNPAATFGANYSVGILRSQRHRLRMTVSKHSEGARVYGHQREFDSSLGTSMPRAVARSIWCSCSLTRIPRICSAMAYSPMASH